MREEQDGGFLKNMEMTPLKEKIFIGAWCATGVALVAYGMIREHNVVFVIGIAVVIGAYLAIRRKLKATLRDRTRD